jgi:hypothetical protein
MKRLLVCHNCKRKFDADKPNQHAINECNKWLEYHVNIKDPLVSIVCDNCYLLIITWIKSLTEQEVNELIEDYEESTLH